MTTDLADEEKNNLKEEILTGVNNYPITFNFKTGSGKVDKSMVTIVQVVNPTVKFTPKFVDKILYFFDENIDTEIDLDHNLITNGHNFGIKLKLSSDVTVDKSKLKLMQRARDVTSNYKFGDISSKGCTNFSGKIDNFVINTNSEGINIYKKGKYYSVLNIPGNLGYNLAYEQLGSQNNSLAMLVMDIYKPDGQNQEKTIM